MLVSCRSNHLDKTTHTQSHTHTMMDAGVVEAKDDAVSICFSIPHFKEIRHEVNRFKKAIIGHKEQLEKIVESIPVFMNKDDIFPETMKILKKTNEAILGEKFDDMVDLMVARANADLNGGSSGYEVPSFSGSRYDLKNYFGDTLFWPDNSIRNTGNQKFCIEMCDIMHAWAGIITNSIREEVNTISSIKELINEYVLHDKVDKFKKLVNDTNIRYYEKDHIIAKFTIMANLDKLRGGHYMYQEKNEIIGKLKNDIRKELKSEIEEFIQRNIQMFRDFKFGHDLTFDNIIKFIQCYDKVVYTSEYGSYSPLQFLCNWSAMYSYTNYSNLLPKHIDNAYDLSIMLKVFGYKIISGSTAMITLIGNSGSSPVMILNRGHFSQSQPYEPSQWYGPGSDGEIYDRFQRAYINYTLKDGVIENAHVITVSTEHETFAQKSTSSRCKLFDLPMVTPTADVVVIDELDMVNEARQYNQSKDTYYGNIIGFDEFGVGITRSQARYIMSLFNSKYSSINDLTCMMHKESYEKMKERASTES